MGEETRKTSRVQTRGGQSKKAISGRSVERADRPKLEVSREVRRYRKGPGREAWKELRQRQRLVPHHGEGHQPDQKGRTRQIRLGFLMDFLGSLQWYGCWGVSSSPSR